MPKVSTMTETGSGNANRISQLHFDARCQPGSHDILRDVARHVAGRAIHLRRIFARERAAAVTAHAAVGIDDDLAAGETGIAVRSADDETAGRIDVILRVRIHHVLRNDRHR